MTLEELQAIPYLTVVGLYEQQMLSTVFVVVMLLVMTVSFIWFTSAFRGYSTEEKQKSVRIRTILSILAVVIALGCLIYTEHNVSYLVTVDNRISDGDFERLVEAADMKSLHPDSVAGLKPCKPGETYYSVKISGLANDPDPANDRTSVDDSNNA